MQSENRSAFNTQKILLATGDTDWGNETLTNLTSHGFECQLVREGKECQLTVYKDKFSTVLLDPDIKNHSGIEVLKYLKLNYPGLRIILVFPDQKTSDVYQELKTNLTRIGVAKSFTRPFQMKFMVEYLNELPPSNSQKNLPMNSALIGEPDPKTKDKDCTRVDIESLFSGNLAIFDYYIRLKENHFVKIFRRGEYVDAERIRKYSEKKVEFLYFLTEERRNYIHYMNEMMRVSTTTGNADNKVILSQMKNVAGKFMEEINTHGLRPELIEESKAISENVYNFIKRSPSLRKIMEDFQTFHPEEYTHCFLVSFFASAICKNLDWAGPRTQEAVSLGAYLHDIGLTLLPSVLRERDPASYTPEEMETYHTHPRLGAEMLSNIPEINYQVVQIVYQHHERLGGEGFPNQLTGLRIYPLAKIVALADKFADLLVLKKVSPIEGIKIFLQDRENLLSFDQTVIRALVRCFLRDEEK